MRSLLMLLRPVLMRLMLCAVMLSSLAAAQAAPNFSGKWTIPGAGRAPAQTLTLNQIGNEVAGELLGGGGGGGGSAAPINNELHDGKAENAAISFYVWRGTDKPYKVTYKGTLNAAGDEIAFTISGLPARPDGTPAPATVIAKRAK
jgi:hypothetical protein